MAKKSKIAKLKHQEALVEKYAAKRAELKAAGDYIGLSKLPRNSAPVRLHHRELAHKGQLPGVKKASW